MSIRKTLEQIMIQKQNNQSLNELIKKTLVNELKSLDIISARPELHIYGRIGTGNESLVPWVGIMNKNLTITVTESIYLVYLFAQDGKKVYVSLNQGVTYLNKLRKGFNNSSIKKMEFFEACAKVLMDEITDTHDLITGTLSLVNDQNKNSDGRSYQHANILAIEYNVNQLPSDDRIISDLALLLEKYEEIQRKVSDYQSFIKEYSFKALKYVENAKSQKKIKTNKWKKTEVSNMTLVDPKNTFQDEVNHRKANPRVTSDNNLKEKLKEQQDIGDLAEIEVLEYFKHHVSQNFGEEKAQNVKLASKEEGHGLGYDIKAFDLETGEEIYIEVKGTKSIKTSQDFFMSINELRSLVGKKNFRIVRVFGVGTGKSRLMIYDGFENYDSVEKLLADKLNAEPINYRIKGIKIN
ncbi:MrcB family domain-containing protein [Bacillus nitratireducens]|uniref:MrcB family domain-containing protein n=1 Tax=Bacillus nitratireducens TaxID=2026193 RepID=UPI000BF2FA09|nr:DUF3578 domain-containing protein [Bacillus nitratireducens]PFI43010.1 hypothetical protein COI72_03530 [Bacillus cereus]